MKGRFFVAVFILVSLFVMPQYSINAEGNNSGLNAILTDTGYKTIMPVSKKEGETVCTYTFKKKDGKDVVISIIRHGKFHTFGITEKGKTIFSFTPKYQITNMYDTSVLCIECKGKMFFSFSARPDLHSNIGGHAVLVGFDTVAKISDLCRQQGFLLSLDGEGLARHSSF